MGLRRNGPIAGNVLHRLGRRSRQGNVFVDACPLSLLVLWREDLLGRVWSEVARRISEARHFLRPKECGAPVNTALAVMARWRFKSGQRQIDRFGALSFGPRL
ncbi:hypothetical protein Nepgr_033958 [Nepenthes gracilis]|uniref:Uncharacterized protein n=1 Tax=Nepenthes gracilis TaxID=150966 RepID=A0AAD3Y917_NEPGR|nr:hypothetical protein Nepgr_033958 [Nepenthes gracilis]